MNRSENQMVSSPRLLVFMLTLLVILPMLATDIYLPALPFLQESFSTNQANVMLTLSAYMIGYSSSLMLSGVVSDRYGRRPIILIGIAIFTAASIACIFIESIYGLILLRFMQAFGGGSGTLLARVVVRDSFDCNNQVRILSYLSAGLALSPTVGPILGGFLVESVGWRGPFVFIAAFSLVILSLAFLFLRESHPDCKKKLSLFDTLQQLRLLCSNREFLAYTLIISLAWSIYFSFIASSSFLLQQYFELGPIAYGFSFSLVIIGYISGTIFTRKCSAHRSLNSLIRWSSTLVLFASILMLLFSAWEAINLFFLLLLVAFILFGVGAIFPATQVAVMRPFKSNFGLIAGSFYAIEMFFGAVAGAILGLFKAIDPLIASSMMAIAALLMCAAIQIMLPHK
jgi:MFS transporter, DHA1 family, multidrug resistance protein